MRSTPCLTGHETAITNQACVKGPRPISVCQSAITRHFLCWQAQTRPPIALCQPTCSECLDRALTRRGEEQTKKPKNETNKNREREWGGEERGGRERGSVWEAEGGDREREGGDRGRERERERREMGVRGREKEREGDGGGGREREGERKRETETDRERQRQTDRQTVRQRDRYRDRKTERQRDRETETETDRQIDRDTHRDRERNVGEQYTDWRRLVGRSDEKPNSFPFICTRSCFHFAALNSKASTVT